MYLEYKLLVLDWWPFDTIQQIKDSLPPVAQNIITPNGKMCDISGTIKDYSGNTLTSNSVPCTKCIDYLQVTDFGCIPMQFNGVDCEPYGDPRPCP
jgi:hypothetical protein